VVPSVVDCGAVVTGLVAGGRTGRAWLIHRDQVRSGGLGQHILACWPLTATISTPRLVMRSAANGEDRVVAVRSLR
jgi:hypothetical protein